MDQPKYASQPISVESEGYWTKQNPFLTREPHLLKHPSPVDDDVVTSGKRGAVFFPFLDRWGRLGVTKMRWFSSLSRSAARGSTRCDRPRCGWVYQHSRHKPQSVEDREGW